MTRTEDRLRDAFKTAAATVRPDTLEPLVVPVRRRRRARWVTPISVVVAVGLIALASVWLSGQIGGQSSGGDAAGRVTGGPAFVMAVRDGKASLEDAATGHVLRWLPGEEYVAVTATKGPWPRYFLASRDRAGYVTFSTVEVADDGSSGNPRPLPGKPLLLEAEGTGSIAVSPDGSKLAVVGSSSIFKQDKVIVVDTKSGKKKTWSGKGGGMIGSATWSPDNRTLGFQWQEGGEYGSDDSLRLLDTLRTKEGALRDVRVLRKTTIGTQTINIFVFNPDGGTLTAQVQGDKHGDDDDADYTLVELSAETGVPTGRTVRLPGDSFFVKTDNSGQRFLQIIYGRLGRVDNGRFSWVSKRVEDMDSGYQDAAW